jgi:hypothetical protein
MSGITKRIDTGRGHSYKMDGQKVDGVTTIINNGIPKPALKAWGERTVAEYAVDNHKLVTELLDRDDRDGAIQLLKGAPFRSTDKAARRGTEVHGLAERIINGEEVEVPVELAGHVDSYLQFLDDWNAQAVLVEAVVGNRTHRWMGTIDLIADLSDGFRWLLDIKTTRSGIFGEVALQLAAYRNAEFYLDTNGHEQPMKKVDRVGAIWVRADGYDLVPVDASPATYQLFRHAQRVATWQTTTSKTAVGDVVQPPSKGAAA